MRRFTTLIAALLSCVVFAPSASAQYVDRDDSARFDDEFDENDFMIIARSRAVVIPGFLLDAGFDRHKNHWSDGQQNWSFGGEFSWRRMDEFEYSLGVDYADMSMSDGFWLESGDPGDQADWTELDLQVLSVVFSIYWIWDVEPWFTPFVGGGIGPAFLLGDYTKYNPSAGSQCRGALAGGDEAPASCFNADGTINESTFDAPQPEDLPPILPIINITGGLRFNLGEYAVLKLETGFYSYLYVGAGIGAQF
jgi:hypothetical protein